MLWPLATALSNTKLSNTLNTGYGNSSITSVVAVASVAFVAKTASWKTMVPPKVMLTMVAKTASWMTML